MSYFTKWRLVPENAESDRKRSRRYYRKNRNRIKVHKLAYYHANKHRIKRSPISAVSRVKKHAYIRNRSKTDPAFKLRRLLGTRLTNLMMRGKGRKSMASLIGCSFEFLKDHIEKQFKPGMTWGNHGVKGWHIDHHLPCASFDLNDPIQQAQCFNFSNLQPLWYHENCSKGAR
jgi:hypothetical protein